MLATGVDGDGRLRPSEESESSVSLLERVKVIEMAAVITGPSAGQVLADLGANVIKIEPPGTGDSFRSWEATSGAIRSSFASFNRGKRSLVLDVKSAEGQAIYKRLVADADVVIENFRHGRMDKLGIGWEQLRELNPALTYCHISGQGRHGPDAGRPTYDAVAQALSGLWSQLTDLSDPEPVGPPMSDQLTALNAVIGILASLRSRAETGAGSLIEVDMLSSSLAFSATGVASTTWSGSVPTKTSRARNSQSYAFAGSDGLPFAIHLSTPHKFWTALCGVAGRNDLVTDPRFETKAVRIRHYDELRSELASAFATKERDHWLAELAAADVPSAAILTVEEAIATEQVAANDVIDWDGEKTLRGLVKSAITVNGTRCSAPRQPPLLGQHTDEVLAELELDPAEVARLRETKVIA
jgi:formyl-CoA transferase